MDEPCVVLHQSLVVSISYYSPCISNHIHFLHGSQPQLGLLFMGFLKHNTSKGSAYEHSDCIVRPPQPHLGNHDMAGFRQWLSHQIWGKYEIMDCCIRSLSHHASCFHMTTLLFPCHSWFVGWTCTSRWSWWLLMDIRSSLSVVWSSPRSQFHLLPTDLSNGHLMPFPLARLRE